VLDERRKRYLDAMGVPLYIRRKPAAGGVTDALTVPPAPASGTDISRGREDLYPDEVEKLGWEALKARVAGCTACELHRGRHNTVFGVGNEGADLMVVGEAPGADEDRQGEPFVGRAGQLLNAMLRAIGFERGDVYIANILKCRPPANRNPVAAEVACCLPFLARQIELVRPRLILSVGGVSAHNLLDTEEPVGRLRGRVHAFGPARIPVVVSYHPAYLLRKPGEKAKAWQDLLAARRLLDAE
jgi:DNA polymerase